MTTVSLIWKKRAQKAETTLEKAIRLLKRLHFSHDMDWHEIEQLEKAETEAANG